MYVTELDIDEGLRLTTASGKLLGVFKLIEVSAEGESAKVALNLPRTITIEKSRFPKDQKGVNPHAS